MTTEKIDKKVCIIGFGKVGTSVAYEFTDIGYDIQDIIISKTSHTNKLQNEANWKYSSAINSKIIQRNNIFVFCLKDDNLQKYITKLKKYDFKEKYLLHTSGILTSNIFKALKIEKSKIASFHPIQTFNKISGYNRKLLNKIYFGFEGGAKIKLLLKSAVKKLNSKIIIIKPENKSLYHLICVFASNFLIAYLNVLNKISKSVFIEHQNQFDILKPLIQNTLNNLFNDGFIKSLTGPHIRNDVETVKSHLIILKKRFPEFIDLINSLAFETIGIARKSGKITEEQSKKLIKLHKKYANEQNN
jgi:predicted short-subunit dehydrogenase-like oxidoreductase (DUF2520 family)